MNCALCLNERMLRNSHIVPEFMYNHMYDDKHRFHVIAASDPARKRQEQKGLRERLLCQDCESQLSSHERYVSQIFSGAISVQSDRNGNLVKIEGLDYHHFRLFGLSILWRAGVSRHEYFEKVLLGRHEESLRRLLAANNPGDPHQYGFFLSPIVHDERDVKGFMVQPTHSHLGGHRCYRFVFGGLVWVFVVSSHAPPKVFRDAFINRHGEMLMLVSELSELAFIHRALCKRTPGHFHLRISS